MRSRGTGVHRVASDTSKDRLPLELRLPCFSSLSRRLGAMTALRRSSPGAQLPGVFFLVVVHR